MIEGRDFPGHWFDDPGRPYGFFTTAFVKADNAEAAHIAAVEAVRDGFREQLPPIREDRPQPSLQLAEIDEVERLPDGEAVAEATWFPMGGKGRS